MPALPPGHENATLDGVLSVVDLRFDTGLSWAACARELGMTESRAKALARLASAWIAERAEAERPAAEARERARRAALDGARGMR